MCDSVFAYIIYRMQSTITSMVKGVYMKQLKLFLLIISIAAVSACSKSGSDDNDLTQTGPFKGMSASQLYKEGKDALAKKQYDSASKRFEALDTMYPFNDYAENAQLDLIYAYYMDQKYPAASATAERFIHLYPRAKRVDYAYYMKGLSNFQQPRGTLTKLFPIDESWRDPGTQNQAYSDFATLVQRFPHSKYKANALQRMIFLRNEFAKHELNIANYYFERRMYVAAAERANFVVETYPQAPSAQPALELKFYASKAMGLDEAANDALKVYQATYHKVPPKMTA
jgi:outer membrane protein assembly factor BamD